MHAMRKVVVINASSKYRMLGVGYCWAVKGRLLVFASSQRFFAIASILLYPLSVCCGAAAG